MPRQARLDIPGALHHIMVRGINRSLIFKNDQDRAAFLERLGQTVSEGESTVCAWVLMNNHVHILFRSGRDGISTVMRRLLTWYAVYFNHRYRRTGHLFENRYRSILCDEEDYLLALVRYIHLNPIRAQIIETIEELDSYPWSGHRAIVGKAKHPWMNIDDILSRFGHTKRTAIREYRCFVRDGISQGRSAILTGGGLIRSQGGWSQVLAMRRRGRNAESDERILGDEGFVRSILKEAEDRQLRQLKLARSEGNIGDVIRDECKKSDVSPEELKRGSRRSKVSRVRAAIAYRSSRELGFSGAEIARHLGVNTSSINRALTKVEREMRD